MADYPIPDLDEATRRALELQRALVPGIDTSPGGIAYREARATAALLQDLHAHIEAVDRDATPLTAEGEALDRWGSLRAVERKGATAAARSQALEVTGTAGVVVSVGLALRDRSTGVELEVAAPVTLGDSGRAIADVRSRDTGTRANLPTGAALDFLAPPAGLDQVARLVLGLEGGTDAESDGAYRARVVNRFRQPPQGGNQNDFEQWALLVEGVDAAFALPQRAGVGTVDIVGLRDGQGTARLLDSATRDQVAAIVAARRPLGATTRVLEVVAEPVDVTVEITPLASLAYRFDWDDGAGLTVASYDPAGRIVTVGAELPSTFGAGARVVFGDDGRVFLAAAVVSSMQFVLGAEDVELLTYVPTPGTAIHAGGPLSEAIRQAVLNGYAAPDGARIPGLNQLGPANDGARYGGWIDTAERDRIAAAALSVAGVYRAQVTQLDKDGADTGAIARPSDPATASALPTETTTIGMLVAGRVLVWRAS